MVKKLRGNTTNPWGALDQHGWDRGDLLQDSGWQMVKCYFSF